MTGESIPILEEIPQPQTEAMEQDTPVVVHEPQNKEEENHQEIPPEHTEATVEVNEMTQHLGLKEQPDKTQAPGLGHPTEDTVGTAWAWPKWMTGEHPGVGGNLSQPTQQEDRVQISSSP
jgi:hypothetical protein